MNAKEAIAVAKREFANLFEDEPVQQVGLEEIDFDHERSVWLITLGFYRTSETWQMTLSNRVYKASSLFGMDSNVLTSAVGGRVSLRAGRPWP